MMNRHKAVPSITAPVAAAMAISSVAGHAQALSLFVRTEPAPADAEGAPDPLAELRSSSFILIEPPEPRTFAKHDIVYIIIDESTQAESSSSLETTKELTVENRLNAMINLTRLLETRLDPSGTNDLDLLDLETENEFEGEGSFNRDDSLNARISAEVIDVKPNGNLVLEARNTVNTDGERRTITLTGIARSDDVTEQNTVLSNQIADLNIDIQNEGELRKATKKGIITKVIEALFNF